MDFGHMSLPIVLAGESLATCPRVVASLHGAVKLLLLFVTIIDMSLQMSFCSEALAATSIRALMVFTVIALVVLEFMRLVKHLIATRLVATIHATSR